MTKISWLAYTIIGIAMMIISRIVDNKTNTHQLILFWYLGILFIIFSVIKIIIKLVVKKTMTKKHRKTAHDQEEHKRRYQEAFDSVKQIRKDNFKEGEHEIQSTQKKDYVQHATIVSCPVCGTKHYDYAHYCMKCGAKLK